jgi:glycosyltransferase involved in cell wall biosynthesis
LSKTRCQQTVNLLVLGQTPPPYVGQMLSIESLVKARFADVTIHHVRMNYSQTVDEIGRVRLRKMFHLVRIMIESAYKIFRHRIDLIYYPPGAQPVPILRDIVTLLWLRLFRRKLMLVFYAGGVSETVASWKGPLRWLFEKAFFGPEAAVQNSLLNPPDGAFVKARTVYCRPNGVADEFAGRQKKQLQNPVPVILFVGMVRADKGVDCLLKAAFLLKQQQRKFLIRIVGEFASAEYRKSLLQQVQDQELQDCVEFTGGKVGEEKWQAYQTADVFCFPTYYANESFGNVLLEAMMFELPVVTTRWRAIPEIVVEGETGFLVDIKDHAATAERLSRIIDNEDLGKRLGKKGRERYLANYMIDRYLERTREIVVHVAGAPGSRPARRSKNWLSNSYDEHAATSESSGATTL